MNFFFLGASGFIGRHALQAAREQGHAVAGTYLSQPGDGLIRFDLEKDSLGEVLGRCGLTLSEPGWGVLCGAVRQIDRCREEPERARTINVERTLAAAQAMAEHGLTPVFLSTSYVFDGQKGRYTEQDSPHAICEYGRHKVEVERALLAEHPGALVLRMDKIVGSSPQEEHLFTEWHRWLSEGKTLSCIEGQVMSPTDVEDIARGLVVACSAGLKGVCHLANPEAFTRERLARLFCSILGVPERVTTKPLSDFHFADPRPLDSSLDAAFFIQKTGFHFMDMKEVMGRFKLGLAGG